MPKPKKKKPLHKLKKDLWRLVATFIKQRDKGVCFTCGRRGLSGSNYHAGHFIKKSISGIVLYFHEDNIAGQCAYCNLFLDGDQYKFGVKLGPQLVDQLYKIKKDTRGVIWDREKFDEMIAYYKTKVKK